MLFNILTGAGLSNNVLKSGDRQAAFRQTPQEHEELLDYTNLPGYREVMEMPIGYPQLAALGRLKLQAEQREQESPKYWLDEYPRRPISQSSSWVSDIDYDPYSNAMQVQLGNKIDSYYKTPDQVAEILNSPSIGEKFNGR